MAGKVISCAAALFASAFLAGADVANACSVAPGPPATQAQIDQLARATFARFAEVLEAEVLSVGARESSMRVARVFKGQLRPGMILTGRLSQNSCVRRLPAIGERGIMVITFGPNGPTGLNFFLDPIVVDALVRQGLISPEQSGRR